MSAAAAGMDSGALFAQRRQPAYAPSFALAFAVHAILLAIMFLGVRLQSHPPQTVSVELWEPLPRVVAEPPKPQPAVQPEPPKPEPKIDKPDIVEKAAPKPKPEPKPKPKPEAKKPPPDTKAREAEFQRQMREQLAREQAADQERQMRDAAAREQASARARAIDRWISSIRNKIRSNISLPADLLGNPEAIYDVSLLPTGEVLNVRLRKSSGHKGYDEAVERAILKSSPLPKPEPASLFERQLELRFRPQDK
jgi:colicin import membrane protein